MSEFNSNTPKGKLSEKWTNHKFNMKLVNPANKRKCNCSRHWISRSFCSFIIS